MKSETKHLNFHPPWMEALAIHEAERIYEMMPRMMGEKTHVIARLQEGILELLTRELRKDAA